MKTDTAYWIALAHLPKWGPMKINGLIVKFHHEKQISIEEFFHLPEEMWRSKYGLDIKQINDLKLAKNELPNTAFLAESLLNEGYEIIPVISSDYSSTLKENLKTAKSPPLIYIKGNKQILQEKSLAIVGSRKASDKSLRFTDNIAKLASEEYKVVVSGFAKGVDKQALDSALKYKGQSIIVLPQGITTFGKGYKTYYKQIVDGDVLVLSTFHPKAPWRVELAMARNPIIYGLAKEIYVAESDQKGGTWSGVIDGLRKGRIIYVRQPGASENNANSLLIRKGAVPVSFEGVPLKSYTPAEEKTLFTKVEEAVIDYEKPILELLKNGEYKVQQIKENLKLEWSDQKLREYLKKHDAIETLGRNPLRFTLKGNKKVQGELFD